MLMRYILSAALCAATLLPAALQAQTITTVAGNGGTGDTGDGGAATSANVGSPWGMAAAADGSYYIGGYNLIRRVGADGVIRAAAGDGTWGSEGDGGPATSARLAGNMNGLAIGPDGHLYIADTFNSRIRKIDSDFERTARQRKVLIGIFERVRAMDPLEMYGQLRGPTGQRQDPCVLDVFMAAHDFMNGGPSQPWWNYTARRKALLAQQL